MCRRIRIINIGIPEATSTRNVSRFRRLVSHYLIRRQLGPHTSVPLSQRLCIHVQICNYACNIMLLAAVNGFLNNAECCNSAGKNIRCSLRPSVLIFISIPLELRHNLFTKGSEISHELFLRGKFLCKYLKNFI